MDATVSFFFFFRLHSLFRHLHFSRRKFRSDRRLQESDSKSRLAGARRECLNGEIHAIML